jgi:hypothetical protein
VGYQKSARFTFFTAKLDLNTDDSSDSEAREDEEQGPAVQEGIAEKNIGESLDDLFGYGSTAGSSQCGCAELLRLNACSYRCR